MNIILFNIFLYISTSYYVRMYLRKIREFEVQDFVNTWLHRRAMTCMVKLNKWLFPYSHAIAVSCNLNYDHFVDLVYKLKNIFKVYEHHFHSLGSEDKWPEYLGSYFMSNPLKWWETSRKSTIHNEMDKLILNRLRKYSFFRSGDNHSNYPYKQIDD